MPLDAYRTREFWRNLPPPAEARFSFRRANPHLAGARPGWPSFEEAHVAPDKPRGEEVSFRRAHPHLAGARPGRLSFEAAHVAPEKPCTVEVTFSRALTDAEMRFFREVCGRTAPLMDGVDD